jgi:Zn-dependent protease with chaperone function
VKAFISSLIALISLFVATTLVAAQQDIEHKIPPGYQPEEARDEQGIWMELLEYETMLQKSPLLVRDVDLNIYLRTVVCEVAGDYCPDIHVYLMRNPGFNASMTATGMMQIWTGLLVRTTTTDELAAVIGHEIAHYTRLHTLERFRSIKTKLAAGSIFDMALILATGYSVPVGQVVAVMSVLAYSRDQEAEADLLGARIMAEAGMDPHAAYRVWNHVIEEDKAAAVKREKPGIFSKTHPNSAVRAIELEAWVTERYGLADPDAANSDRHVAALNNHYLFLMEDQIDTNRFGRTEDMLRRHVSMGIEEGLVHYFHGEMYRQRDKEGDRELAMDAYMKSIALGSPPPEAYKNLGYLCLKQDDNTQARAYFHKYLESKPDASDRAMIEFYLEEE